MNLATVGQTVELLGHIATALGILFAIHAYKREQQQDRDEREKDRQERVKDREDREIETFTKVTDSYVDYLKESLAKPEFSYYALGEVGGRKLTVEEATEYLRFEILVCNLESAFYLYKDRSRAFKQRQGDAWNRYIRAWCRLPWFQKHWTPEFATYYDAEFAGHVSAVVKEVTSQPMLDC